MAYNSCGVEKRNKHENQKGNVKKRMRKTREHVLTREVMGASSEPTPTEPKGTTYLHLGLFL
jgi:hypothetical protein